jgi:hypothetical protein
VPPLRHPAGLLRSDTRSNDVAGSDEMNSPLNRGQIIDMVVNVSGGDPTSKIDRAKATNVHQRTPFIRAASSWASSREQCGLSPGPKDDALLLELKRCSGTGTASWQGTADMADIQV